MHINKILKKIISQIVNRVANLTINEALSAGARLFGTKCWFVFSDALRQYLVIKSG